MSTLRIEPSFPDPDNDRAKGLLVARKMTTDEVRAFLTQGTRTGKVATTRADGRPHVAPIWFVLDGEDVVFMTGADTVKGKTLLRTARAALVVDLEAPPFGFVAVEGPVTLSRDVAEMLPFSIAIARRYVGEDKADEFGRRNAVDGELLVRLRMETVTALDDMTG
jgi:PPOX class probable F420-dependent enzyme